MNIPAIVLEFLNRAMRQDKGTKGMQTGKEEVKLPLFADGMVLYLKDPKDSTRKTLEMLARMPGKRNLYGENVH
jgi:hypothetical protein